MNCEFIQLETGIYRCRDCGRCVAAPGLPIFASCPARPTPPRAAARRKPRALPGTQLKQIIGRLVPVDRAARDRNQLRVCDAWVLTMDFWGVDGCRQHADKILARLRQAHGQLSRRQKWRAAWRAVRHGIFLNPFDPARSLLNKVLR